MNTLELKIPYQWYIESCAYNCLLEVTGPEFRFAFSCVGADWLNLFDEVSK